MNARFLALWTAAVIAAAAAFVVHLAVRYEVIELGYAVGDARSEQRRLIEDSRQLSLEAAHLRQSARVETVARGSLQMDVPDPSRVVPIGRGVRARRNTAGRVR